MLFRRANFASILLAIVLGFSCLIAAPPAQAGSWPAAPTGVRLVGVTGSSITVSAYRSANTTYYKLYLSTVKNDLYYTSLQSARSTRTVAWSRTPSVTARGLRFAAVPYYYRFATTNGPRRSISGIGSVSLRPAAPTSVRIVNSRAGVYLSWQPVAGTGYIIMQGTNAAMTNGRRDYRIHGYNSGFTPYGLQRGAVYYFRVRAANGYTASWASGETAVRPLTREQSVRVLTYNVLANGFDGTRTNGGETVAPWNTARKPAAAALIKQSNPDVVAVEEACGWAYAYRGARQVDTLRSALGSTYSLARTEIPPSQPNFLRTGDYIIYRNTTFATVGAGGNFSIGDGLFGVYQVLRNKVTGARFLIVDTHLRAGRGTGYDTLRESQTRTVVQQGTRIAASSGGVPVIYVGDFNSYLAPPFRPNDGPTRVTQPAHLAEASSVVQYITNQQYNTENLYQRTASEGPAHIDRIFAVPGVALRDWKEMLTVSNGRFVGIIPSDHNPIFVDLTVRY